MNRERVQRYISDHAQFGNVRFQGPHRPLRQPIGITGFGGVQRLHFGRRHRKQRHGGNTERRQLLRFAQQLVNGQPGHARHGRHRFAAVFTLNDEQRLNQISRGKRRFSRQSAREVITAHSAQASARKLAGHNLREAGHGGILQYDRISGITA